MKIRKNFVKKGIYSAMGAAIAISLGFGMGANVYANDSDDPITLWFDEDGYAHREMARPIGIEADQDKRVDKYYTFSGQAGSVYYNLIYDNIDAEKLKDKKDNSVRLQVYEKNYDNLIFDKEIEAGEKSEYVLKDIKNNTEYFIKVNTKEKLGEPSSKMLLNYEYNALFNDVQDKEKDFYRPIYWMLANDITTGIDDKNYGIDNVCTRGQLVTFLWRNSNCQEPEKNINSFKDIKESNPFYKAIMWASEKGIIKGFEDGTFRPDAPCTRGQMMAVLYRLKSYFEPDINSMSYSDVKKDGNEFAKAIAWSEQMNISKGFADGTFRQDDLCTRGQAAMFLFRADHPQGGSFV